MDIDWSCIKNETRFVTKNCAKLGTRREEKERRSERNMEKNSRKREMSNGVQNMDRGSENSYRQKEMVRHSKKPILQAERGTKRDRCISNLVLQLWFSEWVVLEELSFVLKENER